MNVTFRVDASLAIGSGHVMRCLTLANALRLRGHYCQFVCAQNSGHMIEIIRHSGFKVLTLASRGSEYKDYKYEGTDNLYIQWLGCSQDEDAKQTNTALVLNCQQSLANTGMTSDWLVVDSYALNHQWQKSFYDQGIKILVIDDLADRLHLCDLLLDQTFGRTAFDYQLLVPAECEILAGVDYCLLRPEFVHYRTVATEKRQEKKRYNVLITLGGIDEHNVTEQILTIFDQMSLPELHFIVVVGENSPWQERIKMLAVTLGITITVNVGVSNMAALINQCDFAIGAAGSTTWERCCLGLPSALVAIADNQQFALSMLAAAGIVAKLDISTLESDIKSIFTAKNRDEMMATLATNCKQLVDGAGCIRVVEKMENIYAL